MIQMTPITISFCHSEPRQYLDSIYGEFCEINAIVSCKATLLDSSGPDKYSDLETARDEFELVVLCSVNKSLESLPFNNIPLVGNKSNELLKE